MPTLKNNSSETFKVKDLSGKYIDFQPGVTIITAQYLPDNADIEVISDTPYYNPLISHATYSAVGAEDISVSIPAGAEYVKLYGGTGSNILVFQNSKDNTPHFINLKKSGMAGMIEGMVKQFILSFEGAGSCEVLFAREKPNV